MEKEYNKRFKNKEISNDDFDVDGLWNDITDELDVTSESTPTFPWKKWGGSLFLLLILSGIGFLILNSNSTTLLEKNTSLAESQKIESTQSKSEFTSDLEINSIKEEQNSLSQTGEINSFTTNTQDLVIKKEDTISKRKKQTSNSNSTSNYSNQKINNKNIKNTHSNISYTNIPEISKEQNQEVPTEILSSERNTNVSKSKESTFANNEIRENEITKKSSSQKKAKKAILKNNSKKVDSLSSSKINELAGFIPTIPDSLLYVGIRKLSKKKVNEDKENKKKVAFEGSFYGGMSSTFAKFNSTSDATYADTRNTTESSILSSNYGGQIGLLYKGWRVNTGIEFNNIWTKLDTKINTDTLTTSIPQALVLVVVDSTGNTVSRTFQDTTVNLSTTRTIAHYNNFQMWRIPLEIGRYRSGKKWAYGISVGTSFNFLTNQSGRILDADNQILEFDKNADKVLFQSFSMSLRANAILGYKLRENVLVSLRPQWTWTPNKIFNNTLQANIHQANLTLSLAAIF